MARKTKRSGVYELVHRESGKRYIGSAVDIDNRWSKHRGTLRNQTHHCPMLQRAWNKYGENAFDFSVIEFCEKSVLFEREQHYISSQERTMLYNTHHHAMHWLGRKHSPEAKAKMREAHKKNRSRAEKLTRMSKNTPPWSGKQHSEETKTKMRSTRQSMVYTEETRRKLSEAGKKKFKRDDKPTGQPTVQRTRTSGANSPRKGS